MFDYVYNFLHLLWDSNSLFFRSAAELAKSKHGSSYLGFGDDAFFELDGNLWPGWYMLEVKVQLPVAKIYGCVFYNDRNAENDISALRLPLHVDRVNKRLVYLPNGGEL